MSSHLGHLFTTSVGRKWLVGATGLGLCGFVLIHMSGNLLLLVGPEAYNTYAHKLITNPFLYVAEAGLVAIFVVHVGMAVALAWSNRRARDTGPSRLPAVGAADRSCFAARTMILSGLLVLVFTVLHLITFKYGAHYSITHGGVEMRDLYRLVREKFSEPLYVGWYLFALVVLGAHLSHGASAVFQSMGLASVRNPLWRRLGWAFAAAIAFGFMSQPIYFALCGGKG